MRNPNRIPTILKRIESVWKANPDLRLGQLIGNVIDPRYLYEVSDEILIDLIEHLYKVESIIIKPENHKGAFCPYHTTVFCREICSNCELYPK